MIITVTVISILFTGSARCAHVGNYTDSYDDRDMDIMKNKSSLTYQDLFYSKFLTTNDVHVDDEKAPKVKNIVVDNSTNIDNATKYIKISSSIEIPETESVILVLDTLKLLLNTPRTYEILLALKKIVPRFFSPDAFYRSKKEPPFCRN